MNVVIKNVRKTYFVWDTRSLEQKRRITICSVVLSILYGSMYAFGREIERYDNILWDLTTMVPVLLRALIAAVILFFISRFLLSICMRTLQRRDQSRTVAGSALPKRRISLLLFLFLWILCFLSFVPALLAYWPGIFAYDFPTKITQVATGHISTHHPIVDTLLHSFLLQIGADGSDCTTGALCSSVFQMVLLSGAFSYTICFLFREECPVPLCMVMLLFFLLLPVHALFAVNVVKDVLYSTLFLLAFVFTIELTLHRERFFSSPFMQLRFVAVLILMCFFRNTGIYILVVFTIVLTIFHRNHRLRTMIIGVTAIVCVVVTSSVLQHVYHAESGSSSEALSVPIQQVARSYCEGPDRFSKKETKELFRLIPRDHVENYNSSLADDVKSGLSWGSEESSEFVGIWMEKLPVCMDSYVNAFLGITEAYWNPGMSFPDGRTYHQYIETRNKKIDRHHKIVRSTKLKPALRYYDMVAQGKEPMHLPVIALLLRPAAYVWILFMLLGLSWCRRDRRILPPATLLIMSWLLLLLSPIALLRYSYPLMLCVPVLLCMLWIPKKGRW